MSPLAGMSSGVSATVATPGSEWASCSVVAMIARRVVLWKSAQFRTAMIGYVAQRARSAMGMVASALAIWTGSGNRTPSGM